MAQLTLDMSGRGGLAPRFWGDIDRTVSTPNLRYIGGESQVADGIYNPLRRYGYLSPANGTFNAVTSDGSANFDSIITCSIYDPVNDDFYMGSRVSDIFKGDGLDDVALASAIDLGATSTLYDLEIYQVNGVRKLFFVYESGSSTLEVGISDLPYDVSDDNLTWLTGTVSGAFSNTLTGYAFMEVADNGFAYLFQDNVIHKIDGTTNGGTNGTVSANVITFPAYFRCVDAIDYRGLMFIAIHQYPTDIRNSIDPADTNTLKCGVYLWDRKSTVVETRDYIPMEGVKQIRKIYVSPSGSVRAIVVNSERVAEIREYDGSTFNVIKELGLRAYPQFRDSLTTFSGTTTWLGVDGVIYAHGKVTEVEKEALYKIGKVTDLNSGYTTGAILFGGENTDSVPTGYKAQKNGLYISYLSSSGAADFKVKEWDIYGTGSTGSTVGNNEQAQGDVYTVVKYLPQMSTVHDIEIFMYPGSGSGTTTAGTVKIYFNQSATAWASKVVTRDDSARGYKRIEVNKPFINSIQLEVEYPTSTAVGTFDFAPSFAVVEYEQSNTKG